MGFMDAYKRLEKLCGEIMKDDRRVSAYIDEMLRLPNGSRLVAGWNDDLKQLKHYRWVRNQIAHDPDRTEKNMCQPEDTRWIEDFYARIMNQTDPLALYRKANKKRPTTAKPHRKAKNHPEKKQKMMKRTVLVAMLLAALLVLILWTIWGNTALQLNTVTVAFPNLPESFNGFRIAQVSDLHNAEFGQNNEKLLDMLRSAQPDMIAITGDLIDSYNADVTVAVEFAKMAMEIAPCYYVTGNHESRVDQYFKLKEDLKALGVVVLENRRMELERQDERITLIGVNDPAFQTDYLTGDAATATQSQLQQLTDGENYTILLSHRPELLDVYAQSGVNLVLSGHAHGGQFRLPFIGGLVAPNQGLLPAYDEGLHTQGRTTMVVSRGLGNSIIPFRFNNRPEVVLIELQKGL